jgi:hypothetical protein
MNKAELEKLLTELMAEDERAYNNDASQYRKGYLSGQIALLRHLLNSK